MGETWKAGDKVSWNTSQGKTHGKVKRKLTADGVMVQWVPYGQTLDEFLAHVRSYLAVFPNVQVIAGAGGYGFYLIGSDGSVSDGGGSASGYSILTAESLDEAVERPRAARCSREAPASRCTRPSR